MCSNMVELHAKKQIRLRHEHLLYLWCFCEFVHVRRIWPKLDKFLYGNIWQSIGQNRSKKAKQSDSKHVVGSWRQRLFWVNARFTKSQQGQLFLWDFTELLRRRCVWPKLDKFVYGNIYQCAAQNRSKKKEKQSDFKYVVAATLVLS